MKSMNVLMTIITLLSFSDCKAQFKNQKTEVTHIYGNCGMCKSTIEKTGSKQKVAKVVWDKDTKIATISYDTQKTSLNEILKRIALNGYDSDSFLAPQTAYSKLAECCKYERKAKVEAKVETPQTDNPKMDMPDHQAMTETKQEAPQLKAVFENYFAIKDALVKTDGTAASAKAKELLSAINGVKMEKLSMEEHTVWMKVMKDLAFDATHISDTKDAAHQRVHFIMLSKNIYALIKVFKQETPTYFQHCPMANDGKGADWLSKENNIKNPYFGAQMLGCGKTTETIK